MRIALHHRQSRPTSIVPQAASADSPSPSSAPSTARILPLKALWLLPRRRCWQAIWIILLQCMLSFFLVSSVHAAPPAEETSFYRLQSPQGAPSTRASHVALPQWYEQEEEDARQPAARPRHVGSAWQSSASLDDMWAENASQHGLVRRAIPFLGKLATKVGTALVEAGKSEHPHTVEPEHVEPPHPPGSLHSAGSPHPRPPAPHKPGHKKWSFLNKAVGRSRPPEHDDRAPSANIPAKRDTPAGPTNKDEPKPTENPLLHRLSSNPFKRAQHSKTHIGDPPPVHPSHNGNGPKGGQQPHHTNANVKDEAAEIEKLGRTLDQRPVSAWNPFQHRKRKVQKAEVNEAVQKLKEYKAIYDDHHDDARPPKRGRQDSGPPTHTPSNGHADHSDPPASRTGTKRAAHNNGDPPSRRSRKDEGFRPVNGIPKTEQMKRIQAVLQFHKEKKWLQGNTKDGEVITHLYQSPKVRALALVAAGVVTAGTAIGATFGYVGNAQAQAMIQADQKDLAHTAKVTAEGQGYMNTTNEEPITPDQRPKNWPGPASVGGTAAPPATSAAASSSPTPAANAPAPGTPSPSPAASPSPAPQVVNQYVTINESTGAGGNSNVSVPPPNKLGAPANPPNKLAKPPPPRPPPVPPPNQAHAAPAA